MKRKAVRMLAGLLCAAMVFSSNVAGLVVYAMEDGAGQESVSGNDAAGDTQEESGDIVQESAGGGAEPVKEDQEEPAVSAENEQEKGQENGKPDEGAEPVPGDAEEEPDGAELEDAGEEPGEDAVVTVSENTVEEESAAEAVASGMLFSPQVYSAGEFFTVDGKTYNSLDADETYTAGDAITAYYFEADSLLYFDGTGPMEWAGYFTPWYQIAPEKCVIGEGITTIGKEAFYWPNHSLKSVSLPGTLQMIGERGFYQCSELETVLFPEGLQEIGKEAFFGCHALASIDIPESVTTLGESAFYECRSAASIHVPGSIKEITKFAFAYCEAAETVEIGEGVEAIATVAFQSCGVRILTLPGSVKTIGERAFGHSKNLYSITIPDSVTEIGTYAFTWCNNLFEITIGTGVTSIGEKAFVAEKNTLFRLYSENEVVRGYDWAGDRRVIAYRITFKCFDDSWSMTNLHGGGEKLLDFAPNVLDYSTDEEVFTFDRWEPELTEDSVVSADAEYTAMFRSEARKYHVVFKDYDGSVLSDITLPYGTVIHTSKPANPQRAADEYHTYRFSGWSPVLTEEAVVTGDAEYTASYTSAEREYSVRFVDYDGTLISETALPYGAVIHTAKPADPQRAADERYTYQFSGWRPALTEDAVVSGDAEYKAAYTSTAKEYSIRFVDYDGTLLSETALPYGAAIHTSKPADPQRAADERYTYQFSGWTPALTEDAVVSGDAEYKASYTSAEREYSIRFVDYDGTLLSEAALPYGAVIHTAKPADPQRAADERHTYQFSGWSPAITEDTTVSGDAEYKASYKSAERLYVLSFVDHAGNTIKTVMEPYGTKIAEKAPKNPTREPDGEYTYTFAGWKPTLSEDDILTKDTEYQAVFTSGKTKCRVVFQNYDGRVLKEFTVKSGENIADRAPAASRIGDNLTSYTFAGWQPALDKNAPVLGDITYKALYIRKTQTGILSEHGLNHRAGDGISAADIRLYPVYEIYDTSDHFQKRLTDREHPVAQADIRLSKDKIEKGSNKVAVEQISTGFKTEFSVFGSYIDGISVEGADRKVETGSRLQALDVYFTQTRMGEDGQIRSGNADKTQKVKRYTFGDGASYYTVRQGDNEIRITEQETGENHSCTIHVTGEGADQENKPVNDKDKTDKDEETDGEGVQPSPGEKDIWKIALNLPKKKETDAGRGMPFTLGGAGKEAETSKEEDPFTLILRQAAKQEKHGESKKTDLTKKPAGSAVSEEQAGMEPEASEESLQDESGVKEKQAAEEAAGEQEKFSGRIVYIVPVFVGLLLLLLLLIRRRRKESEDGQTEENPSQTGEDVSDGSDE